MRTDIPPALLADFRIDPTTIALLWQIDRADGVVIRGTEHDRDITLPGADDSPPDKFGGLYPAVASITLSDLSQQVDLSVGNAEVQGAFPDAADDSPQYATVIDLTPATIEDGLLDEAPVSVLVCNWKAPEHGYFCAGGGTLGQITRTTDGNYTTEIRLLAQRLQQILVRTMSETCDAQFGDGRCKKTIVSAAGEVTATTGDRKSFTVSIDTSSPPGTPSDLFYTNGLIRFTSGANAGLSRMVKLDPLLNGGILETWESFPNAVGDGDVFEISNGCDNRFPTCRDVHNNAPNNRARGLFTPGVLALTAGPTSVDQLGGA